MHNRPRDLAHEHIATRRRVVRTGQVVLQRSFAELLDRDHLLGSAAAQRALDALPIASLKTRAEVDVDRDREQRSYDRGADQGAGREPCAATRRGSPSRG